MNEMGKDKIGFSVSHTTRAPRPGEENHVHYHFVTREEFEKAMENGEFVETATFSGTRILHLGDPVDWLICWLVTR